MSAIGYVRVSTDEQAVSGLGLEAQEAAIVKYLGGAAPGQWFRDEGEHGDRPDRPGLLAAIEAVHKGDMLVVAKRDRLARCMFLSCWIEKEVKKRGGRIVSVAGEGTENEDPTNILMRRICDAFSEYELAMIGFRTRAAMAMKRARGEKTGGDVPFGYRVDGGKLAPEATEQAALARVTHFRASGKGLTYIASEMGLHPRTGAAWSVGQVQRVLKYQNKIDNKTNGV